MKTPIKYYYIYPLLLLVLILGACSNDDADVITPGGETPQTETRFGITIRENSSTATRTDDTAGEFAINNLKLFVVPLDADGNEIRNSSEITVLEPVTLSAPDADGTVTATFVSVLPTGMKHLYLAANITSVQAGNIRNNWKYALNSINNSEVISPLTADGIAMWQQVVARNGNSTTPDIEVINNQGITAELQPVALERVVAKVILTLDADNQGFVPVVTGKEGWIELKNVRYALDKTAKAFEWTKPAMPGNVLPEGVTGIVSYQDHNNAEWHAPEKVQSNTDNYTGGIFCLENPAGETELQDNATRVVVAARYIPARIWVNVGGTNEVRTYNNMSDALAIINAQKETVEAENTYWCLNDSEFFTTQAYNNRMMGAEMPLFRTHKGGWGYYLTYVNGITTDGQRGIQWDKEKSVISRNSRHILRITRFNPPGSGEMSDISFDGNIYVYATVVPWNDKGGTNSDLEFNEAEQNKNQ